MVRGPKPADLTPTQDERARPEGLVGRRTIGRALAQRAHIDQTNAEPRPFVWTKSADAILASINRSCQ